VCYGLGHKFLEFDNVFFNGISCRFAHPHKLLFEAELGFSGSSAILLFKGFEDFCCRFEAGHADLVFVGNGFHEEGFGSDCGMGI